MGVEKSPQPLGGLADHRLRARQRQTGAARPRDRLDRTIGEEQRQGDQTHALLGEQRLDELAVIYRIHRSTAARRCASARQRLLAGTRAELGRAIVVSTRTVDSVIRMIATRLDAGPEPLPIEPA